MSSHNMTVESPATPIINDTEYCAAVVRATSFRASKSESETDDESKCFVCWGREWDAILLECGHSGLCVECAVKLWDETRRCPLCRQSFTAVMRVVSSSAAEVSPQPSSIPPERSSRD